MHSDVLRAEAPLLSTVAAYVGDPQIRNRGTIGGSLAHADPAADLPAAVLASDATLVAHGPRGRREIAATDFFTGYFETALADDEMLVEIRVPRTGPGRRALREVHPPRQRLGDRRGGHGCRTGGAGQHGQRARCAPALSKPRSPAARRPPRRPNWPTEGTAPVADMNADAEYRRHLARVLTRRALTAAA